MAKVRLRPAAMAQVESAWLAWQGIGQAVGPIRVIRLTLNAVARTVPIPYARKEIA
jgi:hypothetical protein